MTHVERRKMYARIERNHLRKIHRVIPKIVQPDYTWYERANSFAASIHPNLLVGAGVIAALSPQQRWSINSRWAADTCAVWLEGRRILPSVGTYLVRDKAFRILELESPTREQVLNILRGPKITRFFLNIIGETNPVTIDQWMLRFLGLPEKPCIAMYLRAEKVIQKAGVKLCIPPRNLQSAIWVHIREGGE